MKAIINTKDFNVPKLFLWLKELAGISVIEMLNTFNCGIGMMIIIKKENQIKVLDFLTKNKVNYSIIGEIKRKKSKDRKILIKNFDKWDLT